MTSDTGDEESASTVIRNLDELMAAIECTDPAAIEDVLDVEADEVEVTDEGIELRVGTVGHMLNYPFQLSELYELIDEIESAQNEED